MQCLGLSATTAEQLAKERYGEHVPYQKIRQRADVLELERVRNEGVPIKKAWCKFWSVYANRDYVWQLPRRAAERLQKNI